MHVIGAPALWTSSYMWCQLICILKLATHLQENSSWLQSFPPFSCSLQRFNQDIVKEKGSWQEGNNLADALVLPPVPTRQGQHSFECWVHQAGLHMGVSGGLQFVVYKGEEVIHYVAQLAEFYCVQFSANTTWFYIVGMALTPMLNWMTGSNDVVIAMISGVSSFGYAVTFLLAPNPSEYCLSILQCHSRTWYLLSLRFLVCCLCCGNTLRCCLLSYQSFSYQDCG